MQLTIDHTIKEYEHHTEGMSVILKTSVTVFHTKFSMIFQPQFLQCRLKRVRRLFLVCMILFCTDDKCSFPLHTLITDTIESQGGSGVLVKILNRLGVCASLDTLSRFIQYKADSSKCTTNRDTESFTVVSDNIDFMHSFARAYCGQQTSSWHGTTVQAVQPLPSLSADIQSTQAGLHTEPTDLDSTLTYFSGHSLSEDTAYFNHSSQVSLSCSVATTEEQQHSEQRATGSNLTSLFNSSQAGLSCFVATTLPEKNQFEQHRLQAGLHIEQRATGSTFTSSHSGHSSHVHRNRTERSSPIHSPMKLTRSPVPKAQRRHRTGTEQSLQPCTIRAQTPQLFSRHN